MKTSVTPLWLLRRVVLFICALVVIGSPDVSAQTFYREWVRTYALDASKTNESLKIVSVAEGIVVGGSSTSESGDLDYLVIKYKTNGDEVWKQRFNAEAGSQDALRDLAVDPAGSVFVTGTSKTLKFSGDGIFRWEAPFGGRGVMAATNFVYVTGFLETNFATVQLSNNDTDGAQGWLRTYNAFFAPNVSEAILLTESGDILVGGSEKSSQLRDALFSVLNYGMNGDLKWVGRTTNGVGLLAGLPETRRLAKARDGSVYIFGSLGNGGELSKFNSEGAHQWTSRPGRLVQPASMDLTPDQFVVYVGAGVVKMSPNWEEGVAWVYSFMNQTTRLRSVVTRPDGNIYAAGFENSGASGLDMLVVKLSANGILLSTNVFNSSHNGNDVATGMVMDQQGNIYVTGYSTTTAGGTEFVTIKYSEGPKIEKKADGAMRLEFNTAPGQSYALVATTNFVSWQSLITNTADADGIVRFDDTAAPTIPYRFYRGVTVQ